MGYTVVGQHRQPLGSVPVAATTHLASTADQQFSNRVTGSKAASWSAEHGQLHPASLPTLSLLRTRQSHPGYPAVLAPEILAASEHNTDSLEKAAGVFLRGVCAPWP